MGSGHGAMARPAQGSMGTRSTTSRNPRFHYMAKNSCSPKRRLRQRAFQISTNAHQSGQEGESAGSGCGQADRRASCQPAQCRKIHAFRRHRRQAEDRRLSLPSTAWRGRLDSAIRAGGYSGPYRGARIESGLGDNLQAMSSAAACCHLVDATCEHAARPQTVQTARPMRASQTSRIVALNKMRRDAGELKGETCSRRVGRHRRRRAGSAAGAGRDQRAGQARPGAPSVVAATPQG